MFTFSTRLAADRILSAVFDVINDVALFLLALWCCQGLTQPDWISCTKTRKSSVWAPTPSRRSGGQMVRPAYRRTESVNSRRMITYSTVLYNCTCIADVLRACIYTYVQSLMDCYWLVLTCVYYIPVRALPMCDEWPCMRDVHVYCTYVRTPTDCYVHALYMHITGNPGVYQPGIHRPGVHRPGVRSQNLGVPPA